jgi:signal peptidase
VNRKPIIIAATVVAVHALLSALKPGGAYAYVAPSALWALVAVAVLGVSGFNSPKAWYRKTITLMSAAVAAAQIFVLIDVGLLTGFSKSPLSFTPGSVAVNLVYVFSNLLGLELSRAYLMRSFGRKRPLLTLGLVTLMYTFVQTSFLGLIYTLVSLDPLRTSDYLGSIFLPTVSESLLASYLALLGGPIASLAYRGPLVAYEWFLPVLPDLTWGYEALLGVLPPMLGFVYVNQAVKATDLRRMGIRLTRRDLAGIGRSERAERSSLLGWSVVSLMGILMVWFSTGLLGAYPTIPLSGSMRPQMEVGDLAILVKVRPEKIGVGDVIQFHRGEGMVIHRVHEVRTEGGRSFITKGDANSVPDLDPVLPEQVLGRVIKVFPKLGWASIYVKNFITRTWTLLSSDIKLVYGSVAAVASGASIYALRAIRRRPRHLLNRSVKI